MHSFRRAISGSLGHFALFPLLALPCLFGGPVSYAALIATLVTLVVGFDRSWLIEASRTIWVRMFAAAFVLLAIAFIAGAKAPIDAAYTLDFLPLILAAPAGLMFHQMRVKNGALYIARLALAGSAVAAATGVVELTLIGRDRAQGIESSANHFAIYAAILGFLALAGLMADRTRWRWIYGTGPALALLAIVLSGSRGGLLVFACLALAFAFAFWRRFMARWKLMVILGGVAALFVAGAAAWAEAAGVARTFSAVSVIWEVITGQRVDDMATALRLDFYRAGLRAVLDAPWVGHGWKHQFESAIPYLQDTTRAAYEGEQWGYLHNEPIGFAVSGGVLGFTAYWLMSLAPLGVHFSRPRALRSDVQLSMALTVLAGLLVAGMVDALYMWELPKVLLVVLTAAIAVLAAPERNEA